MNREGKEFIVIIASIIGLIIHIGFINHYEHKYGVYYTMRGAIERMF